MKGHLSLRIHSPCHKFLYGAERQRSENPWSLVQVFGSHGLEVRAHNRMKLLPFRCLYQRLLSRRYTSS